jgi:transposase-like protein
MRRRQWTPKETLEIVLQGLRGQGAIAALCTRHQISQTPYYQWRDRLLRDGAKVFERGGPDRAEQRLQAENRRLKTLIGELTVELKRTDLDDRALR